MDTRRQNLAGRTWKPLFLAILALTLSPGAPSALAAHGHSAAASRWLKINRSTRHVTITVIAGLNNSNRGFNFDGYAKGKATFMVPLNWTVQFAFSNHGAAPHSLALAQSHGNNPKLARIGGNHVEIPHATQGIMQGKTVRVSFKAKTAGTYYLICAVPGHDSFGMWDYFTISKHARTPSLKVR
jgi:sulfocyanin